MMASTDRAGQERKAIVIEIKYFGAEKEEKKWEMKMVKTNPGKTTAGHDRWK